jgi:hypothetical protein
MWWRMVTLDNVNQLESWWEDVDDSPVWQERIFDALAGAYLIIGLVALVSLTSFTFFWLVVLQIMQ